MGASPVRKVNAVPVVFLGILVVIAIRLIWWLMTNVGSSPAATKPEPAQNDHFLRYCEARALASLPKLTMEAMFVWAVESRGDGVVTVQELQRAVEQEHEACLRWGWPPPEEWPEEDTLGDMAYCLLNERMTLRQAFEKDIQNLQAGTQFVGTASQRRVAYREMQAIILDWFDAAADENTRPHGGGGMSRSEAADLLGVTASADANTIQKAYRAKVAEWHPDRLDGMAAELRELANQRLVKINEAYRILRTEVVAR